jgi:hypothetical protein
MVTCAPNQNGGGCADGEPLPPGYDNLQQMYNDWAKQDAAEQCQLEQDQRLADEAQYWTNVWQQEDRQIAADQARADYYANKAANDQWSKEVSFYNKYKNPIKTAVAVAKDAYYCVRTGAVTGAAGAAFGSEGGPVGTAAGGAAGFAAGCATGVLVKKMPIPAFP